MTKITNVREGEEYYDISTSDSSGFGLLKSYGVVPKVGDEIEVHVVRGCEVRGVTINGGVVFYKSDEQLEAERQDWLAKHEREKQERFEKEREQMDADYAALPEIFRRRIDRFRSNNPRFRIDYEGYELFCCKEAVKIAAFAKTTERLHEFYKAGYAEQKKMVPDLGDGHSGNTFGCACMLARLYIECPENVEKMHGSLSPLVGSEAFGDVPNPNIRQTDFRNTEEAP